MYCRLINTFGLCIHRRVIPENLRITIRVGTGRVMSKAKRSWRSWDVRLVRVRLCPTHVISLLQYWYHHHSIHQLRLRHSPRHRLLFVSAPPLLSPFSFFALFKSSSASLQNMPTSSVIAGHTTSVRHRRSGFPSPRVMHVVLDTSPVCPCLCPDPRWIRI